jgi:hypothetical protein
MQKRTDFDLPENHKIIINDYWLLGFIETLFSSRLGWLYLVLSI